MAYGNLNQTLNNITRGRRVTPWTVGNAGTGVGQPIDPMAQYNNYMRQNMAQLPSTNASVPPIPFGSNVPSGGNGIFDWNLNNQMGTPNGVDMNDFSANASQFAIHQPTAVEAAYNQLTPPNTLAPVSRPLGTNQFDTGGFDANAVVNTSVMDGLAGLPSTGPQSGMGAGFTTDPANLNTVANGGYGDQWSWFGGLNDQNNKTGSIIGTGLDMGSKMFGAWLGMRGMREAEKAGKFARNLGKTNLANMAKDTNTARDNKYADMYNSLDPAQRANYDTPAEQAEKNKLSGKVGG